MLVDAPARSIVRIILIAVAVAATLYLVYLLRRPIGWLVLATFIAVALSGPVNRLDRSMPRGLAIAAVYVGLLLLPIGLGALVIPPLVSEANQLVDDLPGYAGDAREFVRENSTLRGLEEDYQIVEKIEEQAQSLPQRIDDAAVVLSDIGFGIVNSLFALVTILILAAFILGSGRQWVDAAIRLQPPDRAARLRRVREDIAKAIANYVAGALLQATIAGVLTYVVLLILGVPFRAPLAVLAGLFSLIPLVGATIAAVMIGVVTLFSDFPTATIIWTVWAIVYQQVENNVIQPRIQQRAVNVHPFGVLVAVLFGATLLGVIGALLAIPAAATVQILIREWWRFRSEGRTAPPAPPAPPPGAAPAPADAPP